MPNLEKWVTVISVSALILGCATILSFKSPQNRRLGKIILVTQMLLVAICGNLLFIGFKSNIPLYGEAFVLLGELEYSHKKWGYPATRWEMLCLHLTVVAAGAVVANLILV